MAETDEQRQLAGMLLVAMPGMEDPRFARSVIYLCAHTDGGSHGPGGEPGRERGHLPGRDRPTRHRGRVAAATTRPVHVGGPVQPSRGFVLHSSDYVQDSTLVINEQFALTATVDVLRAIATGSGPERRVLALGYAGWDAGQLDAEIQSNGWLFAPADPEIVFGRDNDSKWLRAMQAIGVDPLLLSSTAGHA